MGQSISGFCDLISGARSIGKRFAMFRYGFCVGRYVSSNFFHFALTSWCTGLPNKVLSEYTCMFEIINALYTYMHIHPGTGHYILDQPCALFL